VPADLAGDRERDEPGQYLDMWTAHRHRSPLTQFEEADALFAAHEAGATKARIRKSTGLKNQHVGAALAVAGLSGDTRAAIEALPQQMTLEDLAIIAEFDGDDQAITRLTGTARWGGGLEHLAEQLRQERAEHAEHERLRGELENAGITITATPPPGAQLLSLLRHDGADLPPDTHAGCPGRGAFFRTYDLTTPVHYCADPRHTGTPSAAAAPVVPLSRAAQPACPAQREPRARPDRPTLARRMLPAAW
jgi:ParB family chromosome partitioning protein